jgi:hypothetical protein
VVGLPKRTTGAVRQLRLSLQPGDVTTSATTRMMFT